jgi:hypothetical protein
MAKLKIMLDLNSMFDHLVKNKKSSDLFIESRAGFIKQLINQRNIDARYQLIKAQDNQASALIS